MTDFTQWLDGNHKRRKADPTLGIWNVLAIRMQVRRLLAGDDILVGPATCFCPHTKVTLSHDIGKMEEEAKLFDLQNNRQAGSSNNNALVLRFSLTLLRRYKEARYPGILQERKELFRVFLATTKRLESPSSVLGDLELEGVMRNIYEFVFPRETIEAEAPVDTSSQPTKD